MNVGLKHARSAWNLSLPTGITIAVIAVLAPLIGMALGRENWQMLALLGALVAVPVVIRWPVVSTFGMYAFLVPFESVAVVGAGDTLTKLVGMASAAVLLGAALIERRLSYPPRAALWWGLFLLWALMSAAWTIMDSRLVIRGMQTIVSLFLLYVIATSVRVSEKELVWVCALAVLGATSAAGWSIFYGVEEAYDPSVGGNTEGRATLMVGDQAASLNRFAASLSPALALAMGGFIGLRSWIGKVVALAAIGVVSGGVFLTMSRGVLLGVATMAMVLLYRFRVRGQVLVVACLLIGVAATMPATFFDRILAVADKDSTGAGRLKIWAIGIEALEGNWLAGAGFKSFIDVYARTVPLPPGQGGRAPHNIYLGTWVELGVIGLTLLLMAMACHLLAARRAQRGSGSAATATAVRAIEAAGYGMLVSAFFSDILWSKFFWLVWILLAWSVQERETPVPPEHAMSATNRLRGFAAATPR